MTIDEVINEVIEESFSLGLPFSLLPGSVRLVIPLSVCNAGYQPQYEDQDDSEECEHWES